VQSVEVTKNRFDVLKMEEKRKYIRAYSRTPLIRHLSDWGCGWNAKKVGLSEYKETFEDKMLLNVFIQIF
jgi:hypothetical protein